MGNCAISNCCSSGSPSLQIPQIQQIFEFSTHKSLEMKIDFSQEVRDGQWWIHNLKVSYNDIYKNVWRCKTSSPSDRQHGGTFLHQKDGEYPKEGSIRIGRGNLILPDSKWDHDYRGIFTLYTQCWGRFSVPISYGLKWMEPRNIHNDLQGSRDSRNWSLCIRDVTSVANIHIMETRSIQQSGRYFPKTVEKPERLCSSLNLAYRESSEKSSNRHGYNNSNTPAWQTQD